MAARTGFSLDTPKERVLEFDALVNLTRLLRGQVLEGTIVTPHKPDISTEETDDYDLDHSDEEVNDSELDALSTKTILTESPAAPDRLTARFLDRFAMMASKSKGAHFVTSTALLQLDQAIQVFISCNRAFDKQDRDFFASFASLMSCIAKSEISGQENYQANKDKLWKTLVYQQKARLQDKYMPDIETELSAFLDADVSQTEDECCVETRATLSRLRDNGAISRNYDQSSFIIQALIVRRNSAVRTCLRRHGTGAKLWQYLCWVAHIRASWETFVEMALAMPARDMTVDCVDADFAKHKFSNEFLSFEVALDLAGNSGKDSLERVLTVAKSKRKDRFKSLASVRSRFDELRRKERHMHAEVQIMLHLENAGLLGRVHPYLGGSRYCCYLCWVFMQTFTNLEARGCHGKLYHKWMAPDCAALSLQSSTAVEIAMTKVQDVLKSLLSGQTPTKIGQAKPESSVGVSTLPADVELEKSNADLIAEMKAREDASRRMRANVTYDEPMGSLGQASLPQHLPQLIDVRLPRLFSCCMCGAKDAHICDGCRSTAYCGPECQRLDATLHRMLCTQMLMFTASRPSKEHRVAIFLPEKAKQPELVWLHILRKWDQDDGISYQSPRFDHLLRGDTGSERHGISHSVPRKFSIGHIVQVCCRDRFLYDGSTTNQCVSQITQGDMAYPWKGPFVITSLVRCSSYDFYHDATLADFRMAADSFKSYDRVTITNVMEYEPVQPGQVTGVRITCMADKNNFGHEPFMPIRLSNDDELFRFPRMAGRVQIASKLGVPLFSWKEKPDPAWADDTGSGVYQNVTATFLHMNCDASPSNMQWGWAPMEWQSEVGSVIVARADEKRITVRQVEALCIYCRGVLQPLFEDSIGCGWQDRTREEVMTHISPDAFLRFFDQLKGSKIASDPAWAQEVCPSAED